MSGTSLDGIDVAVVEMGGRGERPEPAALAAFQAHPYDAAFREALRRACDGGESTTADELCELDFTLGTRFADAVLATLAASGITPGQVAAIGSHGQTVRHRPPAGGRPGSTLQIGEPAVIAERTGITVVADFRVRDMAAGGHGAPLTPYFDRLLLSSRRATRAIQNIGGMANVTALPRVGEGRPPVAFDTGPGVALIDGAVRRLTGGEVAYDRDGEMAAHGQVLERAVEEWLADPFFSEPPPRSTGRERFGSAPLERWMARHREARPEDLVSTLTEVTARSIAGSYRWIGFEVEEVYLCGGGARNAELRRRLAERLAPTPLADLAALGWEGDAREAAAFALLARQHLLGFAASPEWATGARGARILGKRVPA